jgi:nucleotide-binding universal stress UspA family protein
MSTAEPDLAIVVGHDNHPAARAALETAIALARRLPARLLVLHSTTLDDYSIDPDGDDFEADRDRALARERKQITDLLHDTDLLWTYHEQHGDPARALARLADDVGAAYLVVGAPHSGALRHLLGGDSVVNHLLKSQQRPVLVVPEPAPATAPPRR